MSAVVMCEDRKVVRLNTLPSATIVEKRGRKYVVVSAGKSSACLMDTDSGVYRPLNIIHGTYNLLFTPAPLDL
jgi:hypothetical protein